LCFGFGNACLGLSIFFRLCVGNTWVVKLDNNWRQPDLSLVNKTSPSIGDPYPLENCGTLSMYKSPGFARGLWEQIKFTKKLYVYLG
jgi:hypothetical protein